MTQIKTVKFEYTDNDICKIKVVNKSLYLYYDSEKTNQEKILQQFEGTKFKLVPREYVLHVSAANESIFNELFNDLKDNVVIFNEEPRFIAKVTVNTEEEYINFLNIEKENIRIKPYFQRLQFKENSNNNQVNNKSIYKYPVNKYKNKYYIYNKKK